MGQIVKENIDFKRGRTSKGALEVGAYHKLLPPFIFEDIPEGTYLAKAEEYGSGRPYYVILKFESNKLLRLTSWESPEDDIMDPDFRLDYPEHVHKNDMYSYTWWLKNENIISLQKIDWFEEVKESYEFKRGTDSKKALNVGQVREITNPTAEEILNLSNGTYLLQSEHVPDFLIGKIENGGNKYFQLLHNSWGNDITQAVDNFKGGYHNKENYLFNASIGPEDLNKFLEDYTVISIKPIDLDVVFNEAYDFKRGQDSKKGLRVGKYKSGSMKDFEDAEIGDEALDYSETPLTVKSLIKGKIKAFTNRDLDKIKEFVYDHDSTGAMDDFFRNPDDYGYETGDEVELIAAIGEYGDSYVYTYGGEGAYAIWE